MGRKGEAIYRRKDGRWEARFVKGADPTGKKKLVSVYGKTYTDVKNKRIMALQENNVRENSITTTLNDLMWNWLEFNRGQLKQSSIQKYEGLIVNHIQNDIGKLPMSKIDKVILNKYTHNLILGGNNRNGGPLSPQSVNAILTIVGSALRWSDVHFDFKMPFLKSMPTPAKTFTPAEQKKLETYIKNNINGYTVGILLALYTGMRIGEICALEWTDINFDVIYVCKTMQRIRCDNGRWKIIITEPKTPTSCRFIPISPKLVLFLNQIRRPTGHVLVQKDGHFIEPRLLQKWFDRILKENNLPPRNFHSLRHTFATRLIDHGSDPKAVSELLGHQNVQITLNRYVHPSLDTKKSAINKIS